jgi:hypothetical protein
MISESKGITAWCSRPRTRSQMPSTLFLHRRQKDAMFDRIKNVYLQQQICIVQINILRQECIARYLPYSIGVHEKLWSSKLANQIVSRVNINLSDIIYDWGDSPHLACSAINVSTVYWTNDITRLLPSNQWKVFRWGCIGEVNAGAGISPCNIPTQVKAPSLRNWTAIPPPHTHTHTSNRD